MSAAGGRRVVVTADLRLRVGAPDGRSATVVVGDDGGVLRVDVDDVGVLLASLPRTPVRGPGLQAVRAVLGTSDAGRAVRAAWDQDVDVAVQGRVVLRRRGARWRPTGRLAVPAGAAAVVVTGALAGLVSLVVAVVRRLLHRRGRASG